MATSGKHVVLIEDDTDMHDVIRMMLEPVGYTLTCCTTGQEGVDTVRRERPDVILLDIMLSSPTEGFHLAYEMKKDEVLKDTPIIIISSIGQKMGMDFAKELGSDYVPVELFLEKPLDTQRLRESMEQVLEQRA